MRDKPLAIFNLKYILDTSIPTRVVTLFNILKNRNALVGLLKSKISTSSFLRLDTSAF